MGLFDTKSTQTNAPWKPAQPYIEAGMKGAKKLYNSGAGFKAPTFDTYVPMSSQTQAGLGSVWNAAQGGNPLADQSAGAVSGILGGDINNRYNDLYANADNAHFDTAVQNQANKIADDQARYYSGSGRFGSDVSNAGMVDAIGKFREQALSDNWNQNIANQRGILGDQVQSQLGAVAAAPGAYDQRFLPGRAMGQVGAAYDDLAARKLQSRMDKFNTNQQAGWNRLNAYNGAINGTGGGQSGFGSQSVQQPFNWLGTAAGVGLGAASLAMPGGGTVGGNIYDNIRKGL